MGRELLSASSWSLDLVSHAAMEVALTQFICNPHQGAFLVTFNPPTLHTSRKEQTAKDGGKKKKSYTNLPV
ncbi:hypothetical protein PDE_02582 [Penicillium oxalicum 114-2]|uniref:Uncharacterized protein n=1 Tax=Penicillium oxalicum (strain 114-2 / CGMCC 5302) TaxID=933388 RepID=S8ANZ7_PENO1|nr:hypothetical protein PDE_02582 [Penicillium oxalicum 114-2]